MTRISSRLLHLCSSGDSIARLKQSIRCHNYAVLPVMDMTISCRKPTFMMRLAAFLIAVLFSRVLYAKQQVREQASLHWQAWSPQVFEQAQRERRLVLLDLVAEWCAFCKKMDAVTYRDPAVLDVIAKNYIPVRADPEKHPQLPQRFTGYSRPSTVILAPSGTEIIKKQGYLEPQLMLWMLQAVVLEQEIGED